MKHSRRRTILSFINIKESRFIVRKNLNPGGQVGSGKNTAARDEYYFTGVKRSEARLALIRSPAINETLIVCFPALAKVSIPNGYV